MGNGLPHAGGRPEDRSDAEGKKRVTRRWSPAVADLFPETGGWVDASAQITPADAARTILSGLSDLLGTETKAREYIAETMPALMALLPKRKRGRPATATQQRKDAALLNVYDWKAAEGKSVRAVARHVHKQFGIGKTPESVERKLHRLLDARRVGSAR